MAISSAKVKDVAKTKTNKLYFNKVINAGNYRRKTSTTM